MLKRAIDFIALFLLLSATLVTLGGFRSISRADALVFHGPSGQPAAFVTNRGILYFAICNVPTWSLDHSPLDLRQFSNNQLLDYRDTVILNANRQIGYEIIQPSSSTNMNQSPTINRIWLGFSVGKGTDALDAPGKRFVFASAPVWAVVPMLLIFPIRRILAQIKQHRRGRRGQCLACGYDLRESTGRCPECGNC